MAVDLKETFVIGISATALFDMSESDQVYKDANQKDRESAVTVYRDFMLQHENDPLERGTGYPIVEALLSLNRFQTENNQAPLVDVIVMSRNSPDTGLRVLKNIRDYGIGVTRSAFTGGETVVDYLDAFDVDLFLTTSVEDAQKVIDSKVCAAAVLKKPPKQTEDHTKSPEKQVRIAFDGDAVLFSDESELVYKLNGIDAFHEQEDALQAVTMADGPYANLLRKLSKLQSRLPTSVDNPPVRIAIVTARSSPAEMRVINTLRKWGVNVDEAFFLGGVEKTKILKAFRPHIFFDDQDVHLEKASLIVPSGKVPYQSQSALSLHKEIKD